MKLMQGLIIVVAVLFTNGCASSGSKQSVESGDGVHLKKDKDLQGVWMKPGFSFTGKPELVIAPTVYKGAERPNEAAMRAFAIRELRDEIAKTTRDSGVFSTVRVEEGSAAATNALRLVNTILEYEKGGGGARYFAGLYGAGQPVLKVRGELFDSSNEVVFVYEAKRSGEKAASRLVGAFRSDEEIQREDIHDLAIDLADFMMRSAGMQPPKR